MNNNLKAKDFVICVEDIDDIEKNSVGLIAEIDFIKATVFFIGKKKTIGTDISKISFLDVNKTGKPYPTKICNICHILKDENEFDINQTDAKGRKTTRPSCKNCRIAIDGKSLTSVEKKRMDDNRPELLFTCPICEKMSIVGITANFVKDHDHTTGLGREWICDSCNTGLGRFKDDIKLLEKAISYLKKHS